MVTHYRIPAIMWAKKAQNKSKSHSSLCDKDDSSEANRLANSTGDASPVLHVDTGIVLNMDVIQILDGIRNDFDSKIDMILKAMQDVKREVHNFSARMDEAEGCISSIEDTVNSKKGKTEALVKQLSLLTNKLDELENCSRHSNLRLVDVPEKIKENDAVAFLEN